MIIVGISNKRLVWASNFQALVFIVIFLCGKSVSKESGCCEGCEGCEAVNEGGEGEELRDGNGVSSSRWTLVLMVALANEIS